MLSMLSFQLYPRPSRPRDTRCSGGKMTCFTKEPKILSKLHLIHLLEHLFQTARLMADEIFRRGFRTSLAEQPHTVIVIEI